MAKDKGEKQNYQGNFQGVADDNKDKIDKLKKEEKLDEETEYYARKFLEL
ncbi:hypothetical protein R4Z10_13045 [Niallia sp. XMNu-256]